MTTLIIQNDIQTLKNKIKNSYSPYSKFRVASVVSLKNTSKFYGLNVENASYSLTLCAEMVSITQAISNGAKKGDISYIIIYSDTIDEIMPCGSCRQIMSEFFNNDTIIYCIGNNNKLNKFYLNDIFPSHFKIK